jgi:hypothetical protein
MKTFRTIGDAGTMRGVYVSFISYTSIVFFCLLSGNMNVSTAGTLPDGVELWIDDWKLCGGTKGHMPLAPIFAEQGRPIPQIRLSRRNQLYFWTNVAGNLNAAQNLKTAPMTIVHQWLQNVGGAWANYRELSAGRLTRQAAMEWEANEHGYFDWRTHTNLIPPEVGYYRVAVGVRIGEDASVKELTRFDIEVTE